MEMTDRVRELIQQFDDEALSEQRPDYCEVSVRNFLTGLPSDMREIASSLGGGGAYVGMSVLGPVGNLGMSLNDKELAIFGDHVKERFILIGREFPALKSVFPQLLQ